MDECIWRAILDQLPMITSLVRKFVSGGHDLLPFGSADPDDLVNEVLVQLFGKLRGPEHQEIPLKVRIVCLTKYILMDLRKRLVDEKGRRAATPDDGSGADPFTASLDRHQAAQPAPDLAGGAKLDELGWGDDDRRMAGQLARLKALSELQAAIFYRHFAKDQKLNDIARELGKGLSAVKAHIYDRHTGALVKIRAALSKAGIEDLRDAFDYEAGEFTALLEGHGLLRDGQPAARP